MKPVLFVRRGKWCCHFRGTAVIGYGDSPPEAYVNWVYGNLRAMG